MRLSTLLTTTFALSRGVTAFWKGLNVGANNPDGSCKTQAQWETAFKALAGLPPKFTAARLFASSDCNTLQNAVPAAIATGIKLLVGVWTEDAIHYGAEKAALEAAIKAHGCDWMMAVSAGSEDLYRGDTTAATLAGQIHDVRGMVQDSLGCKKVKVGHVDTWTAWVNGANTDVIKACDFVGNDAYPYWQGSTISQSSDVFWTAMNQTRDVVNKVKPGTLVFITETGWPVTGSSFGSSVPSKANAQAYWKSVGCAALKQAHTFWYAYEDYSSNPSFGVIGQNGKAIYSLTC
ncbi:glycoside hydrolase family 17 protein [Rhizodiscina lignyota]|uniref:Probable glucan endo-1,3-beta-glucosidase eglC n=1 Tax=Rhizodiscina lignyota TaxID=1504668 RepID=A0A9P4INS3_9PEZI|nr:glycoside hydrolase family 17 protein [Rhizodiscina lignyota]